MTGNRENLHQMMGRALAEISSVKSTVEGMDRKVTKQIEGMDKRVRSLEDTRSRGRGFLAALALPTAGLSVEKVVEWLRGI